ncbi:hypothetical protein H6G89_00295 [Oscillatoria sp. FACHB-1407]|uniref:hypothetical protein n=1 Tax=Oscillatoria sp. FACHB-1407 TaxID=2692847 RepID=UPI0016837AFA|nr:hypothetical protein [Oscillatoria sp. FACHB-1407]MBD2459471.1 hypothetical protein [Oscillatoria sp. FACHB-1407]
MRGIGFSPNRVVWLLAVLLMTSSCTRPQSEASLRKVQIQQAWELQPGDQVAGRRIAGSLGDITVDLDGGKIYAPFDGLVQPNDLEGCVVFSSPEVPAYLFRWCGVRQPKLGEVKRGEAIASADYLEFAALRRQPDGKWAMVEPASDILQRTLSPQ